MLVARDPVLPGLATVLDVDALADEAAKADVTIDGVEVAYIRYKPGTSCLVSYRPKGTALPPTVYATAFQRESAKLRKARERRAVETPNGPGRTVLDEHAVELCIFPNDDHLPALLKIIRSDGIASLTDEAFSHAASAEQCDLRVLAYKPERRCVVVLMRDHSPCAVIRAYAKTAFNQSSLRAEMFRNVMDITLPRLISTDKKRRLLTMEWLPGTVVSHELLRESSFNRDICAQAGIALAALHSLEMPDVPFRDAKNEAVLLAEIASTIRILTPDLAGRADDLSGRIVEALGEQAVDLCTLHGDFYAQQVVANGTGVGFVDLDETCRGNRAVDIGNFIAHLEIGVLRAEITRQIADAAAAALLSGYKSRASLPSKETLALYTAICLLHVSHEPFRHHLPDWPAGIAALLDRAESVLA